MKAFEKKIVSRLKGFTEALKTGKVLETFNCRTVVLDLQPTEYEPTKVIQTRKMLGASQVVFAQFLGVSAKTVRAWEQGVNPPNDMACRFMDEIGRNIEFWKNRLRESVKVKKSVAASDAVE